MTPERYRQIDRIFQTALALGVDERAAFLTQACGGDEDLRREVEALITSDAGGLSFIDEPAFEVAARVLASDEPGLATGDRIDRYEIVSLLGSGGMGEVYLAHDQKLDRKIALKLLPAHFTTDEQRLRRFQQEARAASALNHPNIITIHEIGQVDNRHFIATEFIDGETLRDSMRRGPLSVSESVGIAIQVCRALVAAHKTGIVHRDIKPENIMVRPDGYVKVLDFGLAKLTEQPEPKLDAEAVTRLDISSGVVMGTLKYMSPEQARGLAVDGRSDIFSLGAVLYEMVMGHAPFKGDTARDLIQSIFRDHPPTFRDGPDKFARIINKALCKELESRYQTTEDLLVDLSGLKDEVDIEWKLRHPSAPNSSSGVIVSARDTGARTAATGPIGSVSTRSISQQVIREIVGRKKTTALVLVVFLVGAISLIYGLMRSSRRRASTPAVQINRLPGTENSQQATISPDGNYVAYVMDNQGQQSLWTLEVATNRRVEIVPPASQIVRITFSPDGKSIYYSRAERSDTQILYQVSLQGGESRKILNAMDGVISFSPDGKQFAFFSFPDRDTTLLMTANADGTGEQQVAARRLPEFFAGAGPAWSPDGRILVCARAEPDGRYKKLVEVEVATGTERSIGPSKWAIVDQMLWLPDGSGLVIVGQEQGPSQQIFHLSYPEGEIRKITNDLNTYLGVALTADSKRLVTSQQELRASIWVSSVSDIHQAKEITTSLRDLFRDVACSPDGKIVYPSISSGDRQIAIMDADGTNQKQLTNTTLVKGQPSVSVDGRYIYFVSGVSAAAVRHIWRIGIDGSDPTQLTNGNGEGSPVGLPDGSVVYTSGGNTGNGLWKLASNGGEPVQLIDKPAGFPRLSPEGRLIAFWSRDEANSKWGIAIMSTDGGPILNRLSISAPVGPLIRWAPDGRAITYVVNTEGGIGNVWSQPIDGSPATQLTDFKSDLILGFDWSRDGKLVCTRGSIFRDVVMISDFL